MNQSIKNAGGILGLVLGMTLAGTLNADDAPPVLPDSTPADHQSHVPPPKPLPEKHSPQTQPSGDDHAWQDHLGEGSHHKLRDGAGPAAQFGATLTNQQIDDALAILREVRPDREQQLQAMRKTNPERVAEMLREAMPRLIELGFLRRHDPDLFKLRVEDFRLERSTQELARQVRQADEAKDETKSKALRVQLQTRLEDHFSLRQKIREHELAQLEKQIAEMHAKIDATKKSRDRLIKERMDELIGEPDRPEW